MGFLSCIFSWCFFFGGGVVGWGLGGRVAYLLILNGISIVINMV